MGMWRRGESSEPALQNVEGEEFLGGATLTPGPVLQVKVGMTARSLPGWTAHSALATSTAARIGPKTSSARARESSSPGRASRRRK